MRANRRPSLLQWVWFLVQILILFSLESIEDVIRGDLIPPNPATAIRNAQDLVHFEATHYLYVEPQLQLYFRRGHHLIGSFPSWSQVIQIANPIYAWAHLAVPLVVLGWIFAVHRSSFSLFRNTLFLANTLALVGYIVYPLAPPDLTPGLTYQGHPFHFQSTMQHQVITTTFNGHPLGYNPYAAMPSLHMTWSIIMTSAVILLSRSNVLRMLVVLYPLIMLFAVVITANHYIMDAVGAVLNILVAATLALLLRAGWEAMHNPGREVQRRGARPMPSKGDG